MVVFITYWPLLVSHVPSNGLYMLYGINISNAPLKALDRLCYTCSTGGRVSTGGCVATGVRVRYSVRWLWGRGCVRGVVAVGLCSMCWPSIRCYVPTIHSMQWGALYIGSNMGAYMVRNVRLFFVMGEKLTF